MSRRGIDLSAGAPRWSFVDDDRFGTWCQQTRRVEAIQPTDPSVIAVSRSHSQQPEHPQKPRNLLADRINGWRHD